MILHHVFRAPGQQTGSQMPKNEKKKLTVRTINSLLPATPEQKRYFIRDTMLPNFEAVVTDSGTISFRIFRRIGAKGNPVGRKVAEHRCGVEYSEGLLTAARNKAREYLADMASGVDPSTKAVLAAEREAEMQGTEAAQFEREQAERAANSFGRKSRKTS